MTPSRGKPCQDFAEYRAKGGRGLLVWEKLGKIIDLRRPCARLTGLSSFFRPSDRDAVQRQRSPDCSTSHWPRSRFYSACQAILALTNNEVGSHVEPTCSPASLLALVPPFRGHPSTPGRTPAATRQGETVPGSPRRPHRPRRRPHRHPR